MYIRTCTHTNMHTHMHVKNNGGGGHLVLLVSVVVSIFTGAQLDEPRGLRTQAVFGVCALGHLMSWHRVIEA